MAGEEIAQMVDGQINIHFRIGHAGKVYAIQIKTDVDDPQLGRMIEKVLQNVRAKRFSSDD